MSGNGYRGGFTLIELLVVMVIIAMLVGMLLPALGVVKGEAQATECRSNLRQVGMAILMYMGDNGFNFPPASPGMQWGGANLVRWHGVREDMESDFDHSKGVLHGYMNTASNELLACPNFKNYLGREEEADYIQEIFGMEVGGAFEGGAGAYGYNRLYVGSQIRQYGDTEQGNASSANEQDFRDLSEIVVMTDAAIAEANLVTGEIKFFEYSFAEPPHYLGSPTYAPPLQEWPEWGLATPTIHFRHTGGGTTNVLWADGHVTSAQWSATRETMTVYGVYSKYARLGWFGNLSNELFGE